jgi:hypothetical protein
MEGKNGIQEAVFDFNDEGLTIVANNASAFALTNSLLKKSAFGIYKSIGKIGIDNLDAFTDVLARYKDTVELEVGENTITLKDEEKSVVIETVNIDFIKTMPLPKIQHDGRFYMKATKLHDIIADASIKGNKDTSLLITTEEGKVFFTNDGKYKFTTSVEGQTIPKGIKVKLGDPFKQAVSNLDGELFINIKSDYPVMLEEDTDMTSIRIIVAPVVNEED